MRFLIRWLAIAIAVAAAVLIVDGFGVQGNPWIAIPLSALIIGLVNATLGLILRIGTIGCIVMTLGLFNLFINALMLMFASWVTSWLGVGITVDGFWPAFWGGLVISIVSGLLNWFVRVED